MSRRSQRRENSSADGKENPSPITKEEITELFTTLSSQMEERLTRKVKSDMDTLLRSVEEKVEAKLRNTTNLPQGDSQRAEREIKDLVEEAMKESMRTSRQAETRTNRQAVGQVTKSGSGRGLYPTVTAAKKNVNRVKPLVDT